MHQAVVAALGATGGMATLIVIATLVLIKPALLLLALSWIGVSVSWGSLWSWVGAILVSVVLGR